MSETTEADAEQKIRETFDQIVTWHRAPLFIPNVGAELRADDDEWPHMALSQLAKVGLDIAAEHLFTIKTLIEAEQILPFAFRSILRTALVGATQAVWLLAPDSLEERTRRHRELLAEMYRRHGQYLEALLKLSDSKGEQRDPNTQLVADHVAKRASQMGTIRALISEANRWNDTGAIGTAARDLWAHRPDGDELTQEVLLEWQAGSGASHGLVWSMLGTAGTSAAGPADQQGRVVIEAAGSYLRIVNAYLGAYHMTNAGWKLLRRRGL